jgi:replicative DNA helicase
VVSAERAARTIADLAARRRLVQAVKRMAMTVRDHPGDPSEILAAARGELDALDARDDDPRNGTLTWSQLMDEFEAAHEPGQWRPGIDTPWDQLNGFLGGLFGGRMYVIGGAPGDGKSTVALNMAHFAAVSGHETLVFSKEMPTVDVAARFVARGAEIDLKNINSRTLNDLDRARIRDWRKRMGDIPLRVNADPITMSGIQRIARAHHHRRGLDLLVVDYLQLMSGDERGRSAEEEIAKISTDLKRLAMELDLAVVVPAQLNRNHTARADLRPTKADLRGSGRIEQDADVVILLWRQLIEMEGPLKGQPDPDFLTFLIDKNRHGEKGMVHLRWNGAYGRVG